MAIGTFLTFGAILTSAASTSIGSRMTGMLTTVLRLFETRFVFLPLIAGVCLFNTPNPTTEHFPDFI